MTSSIPFCQVRLGLDSGHNTQSWPAVLRNWTAHLGVLYQTPDKNHTGINDCCVSPWFCSHPVGPYLRDQDNWPLPRQTIFAPHNCTMTSFIKSILIPHQWQLLPSTKLSHITPQEPHHHQELFKRSPVGFMLKSTGNWPRSWVQD